MPSIRENQEVWNSANNWLEAGDEWSRRWGGVEAQWQGSMLPRLHGFLPARTILEIAPGMGRWTHYLREYAERLVVVDLNDMCIETCKRRFAGDARLEYHVNDGRSLEMVPDGSIDFAFSFDSLVHCEADVMEAYVGQLAKKLSPTGRAFIHHSNLGAHRLHRLPAGKRILHALGLMDTGSWRAKSMTAKLFRQFCEKAGLHCTGQEIVNWEGRYANDCISVLGRQPRADGAECCVFTNLGFMAEAESIRRRSGLYPVRHG